MELQRKYDCEMQTVEEFVGRIQRLVSRGYYFAYVGYLKPPKEPSKLDAKMAELWKLNKPEWQRAARNRGGESSVHYVRFGRRYVLLSTHGWANQKGRRQRRRPAEPRQSGRFFHEYPGFLDLKDKGLKLFGYNIKSTWSVKEGRRKTFVSLNRKTYRLMKASLLRKATRPRYRSREAMEAVFWHLPVQWYGPVQGQMRTIVGATNRVRRRAGSSQLRITKCVRRTLRPLRPFQNSTERKIGLGIEAMERRAKQPRNPIGKFAQSDIRSS
jgi:hypothetical protein